MPYCSNCGAEMPEGAKFCQECGQAQQPREAAPTEDTSPSKESAKPKRRKGLKGPWLLLVPLVVGAVGAFAINALTEMPLGFAFIFAFFGAAVLHLVLLLLTQGTSKRNVAASDAFTSSTQERPKGKKVFGQIRNLLVLILLFSAFGFLGYAVITTQFPRPGPAPRSPRATSTPRPTRPTNTSARCMPKTFTGNGDDVVDVPSSLSGCTKATLKHNGKANFIVWALDASNEPTELLVNHIGGYSGTVRWHYSYAGLEVTADGSWSIAVE